jgi:hypothetical protein
MVLNYSNCCVYPFIYLVKYEEFQKGVLSLIGRKKPAMVHVGPVAGQAANNRNDPPLQMAAKPENQVATEEGPGTAQCSSSNRQQVSAETH